MFACIFVPNFPSDGASRHALLDCAYAFSPRVEDTAQGTVVFDIDGLETLFGSHKEIKMRVAEQVAGFGWTAFVEIAPNPDAAVIMARGGGRPMKELPIDVLAPPEHLAATLERWGIRTLGAFAKLAGVQVSERLGQEGVYFHKLARGTAARPLKPHTGPLQFIESMELDYAIESIEPLTFVLSRLLDQICLRLRTRNLSTHEIRLTLFPSDTAKEAVTRTLSLPLPIRNSKILLKLLILDLEAHPSGFGIGALNVEAIPAKPRVIQNGLFIPLSPEPEKLELTMARISAVVGEGNIGVAELLDTHRPDAFRIRRELRECRESKCRPSRQPRPISLRVFRPPFEATVQTRNSIPVWLAFHGARGSIVTASGPWHTSGDWWSNDHSWNREEWDIEVNDSLYRIYWDVSGKRWFVQGVYD